MLMKHEKFVLINVQNIVLISSNVLKLYTYFNAKPENIGKFEKQKIN